MRLTIFDLVHNTSFSKFIPVNTNELVKHARKSNPTIYKDPAKKQSLIRAFENGCGISWGGYGENRADMWAGTYMDTDQKYIHLGVDINVPHLTPISLPFPVTVVDSKVFTDMDIGWGPRLILKTDSTQDPYIVFGHLSPTIAPIGSRFEKFEPIALVGTFPENGNVFEHLHIQLVARDYLKKGSWEALDGYGHASELKFYPDPFAYDFMAKRLRKNTRCRPTESVKNGQERN